MNFNKFKLTSKLFLITGLVNIVYVFFVRTYLNNPEIGQRFQGFNGTFYISDIYLYLGLVWIIFAFIYLADDYYGMEYLSERQKRLHFYLTLPMVIVLILTPIIDTYYPLNDSNRNGLFDNTFTFAAALSTFGVIFGLIIFIINFLRGILYLTGLIKR